MSVLVGVLHLDGAPGAATELPTSAISPPPGGWEQEGACTDGPVAFLWRRRWMTPEAASESLPIVSSDGRLILSYSGRIDNRDELIARYRVSREVSDGGLLAAVLARDGADGLRWCVGDFVLAAWDRAASRLWLARDALGHRPLYYILERERLWWATDMRVLRAGPARYARPNAGYLAEYLSGSVTTLEETVFERVRRVPPAHAFSMAPGDRVLVATRYWTPPGQMPHRRSDADLIEEFRERFTTAVRASLRARGPVAAQLSGGLDSSSVVALAAVLAGAPPDTYSLVFPGAPYSPDGELLDETSFIEVMTAATGARSFRWDPRTLTRGDLLRVLRVHGDLPDMPNADAVVFPLLRAAAGAGQRVMLTGLGGDYWLTGSLARLPGLLRGGHLIDAWRFMRDAFAPTGLHVPPSAALRRIIAAAAPRAMTRAFRRLKPATPWPAWLRPGFAEETHLAARLRALPARVPPVADAVLRDSLTLLAGAEALMVRESYFRTASDTGSDVRHPFLDRRVVEFVIGLPDDLRFRHGETRYILRQAMRPWLPPAIAERQTKGGGSMLLGHALAHILAKMPMGSLRVADAGWVDGARVRAACAEFTIAGAWQRVPRDQDTDIWNVVAVEAWLRAIEAPPSVSGG